ncbi:MAG: DUF4357 domain-containing protein [Corynebacterium sp.]|nr:DUF4357 domain-containing protein [Corynebacterium sp.]
MHNNAEVMEITLLDGTYRGPRKVTIATIESSYSLFIIPRESIASFSSSEGLNQPGIYMLVGDLHSERPELYIGQANKRKNGNGAISRIQEHFANGRHLFCETAIVLVDNPLNFGATELNSLENSFTRLALKARRTELKNGCEPTSANLDTTRQIRLERVIGYTQLMLATLGIEIYEPRKVKDSSFNAIEKRTEEVQAEERTGKHVANPEIADNEDIFYLKHHTLSEPAKLKYVVNADGTPSYVLLAGSEISREVNYPMAEQLREEHADSLSDFRVTKNIAFDVPSRPSILVVGKSRNGWVEWKTLDGQTLSDIYRSE